MLEKGTLPTQKYHKQSIHYIYSNINDCSILCKGLNSQFEESNIVFSTDPVPKKSKTKSIFVIGKRRNLSKPAPLTLCGRELPFVNQAEHLGSVLTEQGDMEHDASIKRAKFIDGSVKTREMFSFADPCEVIKAIKLYNSSFYGSSL